MILGFLKFLIRKYGSGLIGTIVFALFFLAFIFYPMIVIGLIAVMVLIMVVGLIAQNLMEDWEQYRKRK